MTDAAGNWRPDRATERAWDSLCETSGQLRTVVAREGIRGVAGRILNRLSVSVRSRSAWTDFGIDPELLDRAPVDPEPKLGIQNDLVINWVVQPPAAASGGYSTLFRLVRQLEARGHHCNIYVQYRVRRSLEGDRDLVAGHYGVSGPVRDVRDGMAAAHATVATSWPTAYEVRSSPYTGTRFYLVQDFEPYFYPVSSTAALAENTYRFGFHGLTAGRWLARRLSNEYGMVCHPFELSVDLDTYRLRRDIHREGVVFFARPSTPRRGFELGMLALEMFHRRYPEVPIHLVGEQVGAAHARFPFTDHGYLSPAELCDLYNRCAAGLVLSLTNLSLLPAELLAAGCIPVMNDAEHTRCDCTNRFARFAAPEPAALAASLAAAVFDARTGLLPREASMSVSGLSWERVGDEVEAEIRRVVRDQIDEKVRAGA